MKRFWTQSGLSYYNGENGFELSPFYRPILQDIERLGLSLCEKTFSEIDLYLSSLKYILQQGQTVGVYTNTYSLPFCPFYQNLHELHALEILAESNDQWTVADHYYKYFGTLSTDELKQTFISAIENNLFSEFYLVYLKSECDVYKYPSLNKIIEENFHSISGNQMIDFQVSNQCFSGLKALTLFQEKLNGLLTSPISTSNKHHLKECYKQLKEMANSRHNFYFYLKNVQENSGLSDLIFDSAQNWSVVTNMVLRVIATNKYENMNERINKRFKRVCDIEDKTREKMNELITESVS
ncbi:hypothetical protein ACWOMK_28975 [Bacillus thuringiensis]|uniref:hypothetical protein n=1 Tax=Bacillus tropicus TaxID=2026188 RepID=UPI0035DEBA6A